MKFLFFPLFFILISCQVLKTTNQQIATTDRNLYRTAIANSMYPDSSKVDSNLVAISTDNSNLIWKTIGKEKYVLMVTWKQTISYYQSSLDTIYNTGNYPIWVTSAPELKNRFQKETIVDTNYRLKQFLGLPPNATYSYFVEFWVKPQDLFRPCPDKEINDKKCQLCFSKDTEKEHINWINENRISRYYQCDLYNQYPWSQLGYTYDWNPANRSHVGFSEFVIKANSQIYVKAIYTTSQYLKN